MSTGQDMYIVSQGMHPFWVFADLHGGKHVGGKFLCFINAHYPVEMVSDEDDVNKRGADKLKSGEWLLEMRRDQPNKKIGWGVGNTPQDAFRKACYSSGYLKVKDVS